MKIRSSGITSTTNPLSTRPRRRRAKSDLTAVVRGIPTASITSMITVRIRAILPIVARLAAMITDSFHRRGKRRLRRTLASCSCLGAAACAMLSSCYSNYHQAWFQPHREYVGFELNYATEPEKETEGLPPVIYRCGDEWYIAAVRCKLANVVTAPGLQILDGDGDEPSLEKSPESICFHKITSELAYWLLRSDQESHRWMMEKKLRQEMKKAGGEWVAQLPEGAQSVPAPYLQYAKRQLLLIDMARDDAPWYSYPMAGLTLVCVDVPFTASMMVLYCCTLRFAWKLY